MVGLLFPGQGSQSVGMGRALADAFPEARHTFDEADDALGFSLSELAWHGPEHELTETLNAQPAILTHSIAVYRTVQDRLDRVACAAGHSLGEFSAHVAAGTLKFADAVRAVRRRGELMHESGTQRPGTMAAILGLEEEAVEEVCREAAELGGDCVAANYNAPGQTVISGDVTAVERAVELAKEAGARRALPLNVSGAFHSPLMQRAEAGLAAELETIEFDTPRFPVVANVSAEPVDDPLEARRLLIEQLTAPVRWTASMHTMRGAGAERMFELGPGTVLKGLFRRIDRDFDVRSLGTAEDVETLAGE